MRLYSSSSRSKFACDVGGFAPMPMCKQCESEVDRLVSVKIAGKSRKMCEDCADRARESAEVAEASEDAIRSMMGYKGKR